MKFLLVTEKCSQTGTERDGGAQLVETLKAILGESLSIMQFGSQADPSATWHFEYPYPVANRFERRIAHAPFIAEKLAAVAKDFTHILFVHICMQFGLVHRPLSSDKEVWTFPMFLTPSYRASGESIPEEYVEMERLALRQSKNILTPSNLEKQQLISYYAVLEQQIHVIPRGIDKRVLRACARHLDGPLNFCSVGSIKPQKNTLGLIHLFAKIHSLFPDAHLDLIGPVQNSAYYADVRDEIRKCALEEKVNFTGYVSHQQLSQVLQPSHVHLSTSSCETFGRAIFETLACGLPNIARKSENAAAEFLRNLPYIYFVDDDSEALWALEKLLENFSQLSALALEVGDLYDDGFLMHLLAAKICGRDSLAISDYDGTLFHKHDPAKTQRCVEAFRKFPFKIVCSARSVDDVLAELEKYQLTVDWIIGYSGACVATGQGERLWSTPLGNETAMQLERLIPGCERIEEKGHVIQLATSAGRVPEILGTRTEAYQGKSFIAHWQASKLRAVHRLLRMIGWTGQVQAFGDGPYDAEFLTYFDGISIVNKEIVYV